jgi:hypothetical protein
MTTVLKSVQRTLQEDPTLTDPSGGIKNGLRTTPSDDRQTRAEPIGSEELSEHSCPDAAAADDASKRFTDTRHGHVKSFPVCRPIDRAGRIHQPGTVVDRPSDPPPVKLINACLEP